MKKGRRVVIRYSSRYEKALPQQIYPMPNGHKSSLICPLPRNSGVRGSIARARSSTPSSSTSCEAAASGAYCLTTSLEMAHRLRLLQKMALREEGSWEKINRAIRERLRVRLKRNPQSPVLA